MGYNFNLIKMDTFAFILVIALLDPIPFNGKRFEPKLFIMISPAEIRSLLASRLIHSPQPRWRVDVAGIRVTFQAKQIWKRPGFLACAT